MLNFTVGPVMSPSEVLEVSAKNAPYFRTPEFSQVMLENERIMLGLLSAPRNSRCVFLTASGTGSSTYANFTGTTSTRLSLSSGVRSRGKTSRMRWNPAAVRCS